MIILQGKQMKKILLGCLTLLITKSLQAEPIYEDENHWHLGVGVGGTFPHLDNSFIKTGDGWPEDKYTANPDGSVFFSFFTGYTWENDNLWLPAYSLRLNYLYGLSADVDGHVEQFSLPEFKNYKYQYQLQSQALLGVLKVDLYRYRNIMPFVSAGLGVAWNKFSDYDEQALEGITPRVSPQFASRTHSDFAYTFGAGFDFSVTERLSLTLEYNFDGFGHLESGESQGYGGDNIESELNTNMILLSVVFLQK